MVSFLTMVKESILPKQNLESDTVLKIKLLTDTAKMPFYGSEGAAAFDVTTTHCGVIQPGLAVTFSTGLAFEIPKGYYLEVVSRSGHGFNHSLRLANCVGVIDSDYRGELKVRIHNDGNYPYNVKAGERVAQCILKKYEVAQFEVVDELSSTERGEGGFGSTGK